MKKNIDKETLDLMRKIIENKNKTEKEISFIFANHVADNYLKPIPSKLLESIVSDKRFEAHDWLFHSTILRKDFELSKLLLKHKKVTKCQFKRTKNLIDTAEDLEDSEEMVKFLNSTTI